MSPEKSNFYQEVNATLREYENKTGKQIRFVEKIHRPFNFDLGTALVIAPSTPRLEVPTNALTGLEGNPLDVQDPTQEVTVFKRSERANGLVEYVRGEIERFESGEIDHFSTNEQLRQMFDYPLKNMVSRDLSTAMLSARRRSLIKEADIPPGPSTDYAWLIGVLSGGGYVSPVHRQVHLSSEHEELTNTFKLKGETVFKVNGKLDEESNRVDFYNKKLPSKIGDLRREYWPDTIREKHNWILENDDLSWSFLEGLFEAIGHPRSRIGSTRIIFTTTYSNAINFIADLLVKLGVKNPTIKTDATTKEGIKGVGVYNAHDIKLIAEHIQSVIPWKKEALEKLKEWQPGKKKPRATTPPEALLEEWRRLTNVLGRSPSWEEVDTMRKQGLTKFSHGPYLKAFGNGKFAEVRKALESRI